jgi:hypothetical protein
VEAATQVYMLGGWWEGGPQDEDKDPVYTITCTQSSTP